LKPLTSSVRFTISTTMPNASRAHESSVQSAELAYPPSAHTKLTVRKAAASRASTVRPPARSCTDAEVTATTSCRPIVSTITCLFRPVVRFPASNPRASPPSLVLIDWASITAADGSGPRPAPIRGWWRSSSWLRAQLPSRRHLVNQRCAASQGMSRGSIRHWQPERRT
jgi:hypothetical protein